MATDAMSAIVRATENADDAIAAVTDAAQKTPTEMMT
jgi:hypothetical protein